MTTLRLLGPIVTLTALLRVSIPRKSRSRASVENLMSLAAMFQSPVGGKSGCGSGRLFLGCGGALDHAHNVGLLHDQEILTVQFDLSSRPFAEQHAVAGLQIKRDDFAALIARSRADGHDFTLLRLLLGVVWNDNAALRLLLAFDTTDDDAIVQRPKLHEFLPIL